MGGKDFTGIDTGRIYDQIKAAAADPVRLPDQLTEEEAAALLPKKKDRRTYTDEEKAALMQRFKTSGHKGVKLPRINVAFAPDTYEYIQTMAQVRGETMTRFIDHIIRRSMEENAETYAKAIEFRNSI